MFEENILEVNTKLKAYKLIHDPTVLLNLIYSKYGDIEEDFDLLYINQLVYDKSSRYNIYFKEYQFYYNDDEYLKRFYKKYDSKPRIPKLSEYYKNYHVFFCRPRFKDLVISDLIQSYEDDRAELFYKKNFEDSNSKDEDKSEKHNSESLSSLDNITDNKIIFTKKTKKIIDKNLESNCGTLTLTTNSINGNNNNNGNDNKNSNNYIKKVNNDDGLISSRDVNDSFEKIVHNLIYFKKNKKKIDKTKNKNKNTNNIKKKEKNKKEEKPYIQGKNYKFNNSHNNNISRKVTSFINNKISLFTLLKQNNTITYSKKNKNNTLHNKNNNNINEAFFSPKMNKENIHFSTKLEEFKNNLIKPNNNTSHHHQRNKTFNFNQNQTAGLNTVNNLTNIINMKNNNSRNNHLNINLKQMTQFNNFLTVGNNVTNGIKVSHNKNKTFDNTPNFNNSLVKKIPTKILPKNNNTNINNNKNNENNNNQIIIKRNNLVKSKFNLVKNPLNKNNINNKIKLNKNIKNTNFKYYNTKFSPSNCLYKNMLANKNMNINLHKKNKTTYLSTMFEVSPKNNAASPKIVTKQQKQYYNINKSDNISSKIKPKIGKSRINNLNINFNNVIFNAPLSNINENININNNSNSFNLISVSNNNFRNNGNSNTFLNNNNYLNNSSNANTNNNLSEGENPSDKNIYILNLKNVYNNISRNKANLYGTSLSQSDNYSLSNNNQKINYESNNRIINHTYSNLYSNDKHELINNKKNKISIKKSYNNKSGNNQKNSKKMIKNSAKKSNKNIKTTKTKKNEYGNNNNNNININNLEKNDKNKKIEKREKNNASFHCKDNNNNTKNMYLSPKTTGRSNIPQPINVNRNSNLFSKNLTKSRKKIK